MASAPCSGPSAAARVPRPTGAGNKKMACLCSPTSHPGSFRCSQHRTAPAGGEAVPGASWAVRGRSVRALLLQRIGGVPGELGRRRRGAGDFQPRPSRLRLMKL